MLIERGYIRNETKADKVPGINGSGRINRQRNCRGN